MPFVTKNEFVNANQYSTQSTGETASLVSSSTPLPYGGKLLGLIVSNVSRTNGWAQVFDGYAAPSSGSVPILNIQVGAGLQNSLDCSVFNCLAVTTGIVVVLSSTINTYTPISSGLVCFAAWIN
jgi:hypothetical protein